MLIDLAHKAAVNGAKSDFIGMLHALGYLIVFKIYTVISIRYYPLFTQKVTA